MKKLIISYFYFLLISFSVSAQNNFTGRWVGTYGSGSAEGSSFYSFNFDPNGSIQLYDATGKIIANGNYAANGNQFTSTYAYTGNSGNYSVGGNIDGSGVLRGTWGSGTNVSGGGKWVMNKTGATTSTVMTTRNTVMTASGITRPTKGIIKNTTINNTSGDNSSVYTSRPTKIINTANGRKITVELNRTPSTGTEPLINKVKTQRLPDEKDAGWTTEVTKIYLTAESTTFMNASNSNTINIVPGAIYSFEDFIGGANNEILGNRNPIRLYTDNPLKPGATGGIVVNNPSAYEILQGNGGSNLNVIKNSINESSSGARFIYRSFTSNSEAELSLKVTAGGSYSGFSASGGYSLTQNKNRFYLTIDAIKPMYTIKAERPQNGFYASSNSVANKVYVKEVNYGSRVLANVEIVLDNREDIINFKAAYEGTFSANLGMNFINKNKNKNETLNAYVIGAPITVTSFNKDKLEEEIRTLLASCSFQHAQPISYTLGDMDGNTVATKSATDEITERNSVPDNLVFILQEATLEIATGDDNKEWQSRVAMELYSGNGNILFHQPIENSKIEFPINQAIKFGLNRHPNTLQQDLLYDNIKNSGGFKIRIFYNANIFTDAWKIDGVKLRLKFVDQNGVPYPSTTSIRLDGMGFINCANATGILDGFERKVMECYINGNFSPTTSTIKKN